LPYWHRVYPGVLEIVPAAQEVHPEVMEAHLRVAVAETKVVATWNHATHPRGFRSPLIPGVTDVVSLKNVSLDDLSGILYPLNFAPWMMCCLDDTSLR